MASTVVPGRSSTTMRSSDRSALTSDDLPTLGRPDDGDADRVVLARVRRRAAAGARRPGRAGRRSRAPARPRRRSASPRPRRWNSASTGRRGSSALLTTRMAGQPRLRSERAMAASRSVGPVLASPMKSATAHASSASSAWRRTAASMPTAMSGRKPPVSTSRKLRPFHSASAKWRSFVIPGRSSTTAMRWPRMRLNSVDLPTLGRPMMATIGWRTGSPRTFGPGEEEKWSGQRDLNPQLSAWEADTLPLSYARPVKHDQIRGSTRRSHAGAGSI